MSRIVETSRLTSRTSWLSVIFLGALLPPTLLLAEDLAFVTPGPNVNVIGATPGPSSLRIPDLFRKQQNEPSCIQATDNPAHVFCGFNDCRASDWSQVQGDCWIGVAQSRSFGENSTSRLAPGYLLHPYSLGMGFAADASVTEIPGNPAGLVLLSGIATYRDSDEGVIFVQRYGKSPREDGEPFLPVDAPPTIVATGSEGRFHDKVASLVIVPDDDPQSSTTEYVDLEGISDSVRLDWVDSIHVIAYSVFTGNGSSVKVQTQFSTDGGKTYSKPKKISEELNTVTGVHLSYVPGKGISLTYRRSRDSNETDAIVQSFSGNLGRTWTKTNTVYEICPHDQQASGNSARMFTFPWGADDGERFWVFSSDKVDPVTGERIASMGTCDQVAGAPAGTYPGVSRIVGMSSLDGQNWFGSAENPDEPFVLDFNMGAGYQMFPFSQGVKNRVDIAWWDTREEDEALRTPPAGAELPIIYDYLTSSFSRVFRKASIYMTRISGCKATTAQGACTPRLPTDEGFVSPVRVSRYQTAFLNEVLQEVEANPLNLRTHGSGRLAYNGDYGAMATRRFRRLPSGNLIQNSLPQQLGETSFVANENIFLAWGENRDVFFGNAVTNPGDPNARFPYSPPINAAPSLQAKSEHSPDPDKAETLLADKPTDEPDLKAVGEPDDELGADPDDDVVGCQAEPLQNFSSSRDSNVYGSHVEDVPMLVALTAARPMNLTQRMFPLVFSNPGTEKPGANFCLEIANQPLDWGGGSGSGRASFDPLPARNNPDVFIPPREYLTVFAPPLGSVSRALFVTSSDPGTRITVNAYEGQCQCESDPSDEGQCDPTGPPPSPTLIGSVVVGDGELFDPLFCQENKSDPACVNPVLTHETHNISLAAPSLQAPSLQAPSLQANLLGAPSLQAEGLLAPSFQAEGQEAPSLQAPSFQAVNYESNSLISPSLQAPSLQAPSLQAALLDPNDDKEVYYQDLTRIVVTGASVTTTYSADIAIQGLNADETWVELIAWQPNVHTATTVVNGQCVSVPEADNTVITAVELGSPSLQASSLNDVTLPFAFDPDNQNPYAGEISFPGKPGDIIYVTTRLWVTGESKETLDRLYACSNTDPPPPELNCQPQEIEHGAFLIAPFGAAAHGCNTTDVFNGDPTIDCISAGAEKITPPDLFPPEFIPPDQGTATVEAESADGTVLSTPGTLPSVITVTDSDPDVTVECSSATLTINDDQTLFPIGDTVVDCTAEDTSFNSSSASITIAVVDSFDPTITVPADITSVDATGPAGAAVSFSVTATDAIDPDPDIVCTINGGTQVVNSDDTFPLGTTVVSCTATDQSGNTDVGSFSITVVDITAPQISVPQGPFTEQAAGPEGAVVAFNVSATDIVDASVDIECKDGDGNVVVSGDTFALGVTTVTCTATDDFGNSVIGTSFDVVVQDTVPPQFNNSPLPDVTGVEFGQPVTFDASATDTVDTDVDVVCRDDSGDVVQSGDTFGTGSTTVTCTASDDGKFGDGNPPLNTRSESFTISVLLDITGVVPTQNPDNIKTGTSVPFTWAWLDENGSPVFVSAMNQSFEVRDGTCATRGALIFREDPGGSGLRVKLDNTNQFNFQAVDDSGNDLPASPQGVPYCAIAQRLESGVVVQEQDGNFKLKQ